METAEFWRLVLAMFQGDGLAKHLALDWLEEHQVMTREEAVEHLSGIQERRTRIYQHFGGGALQEFEALISRYARGE